MFTIKCLQQENPIVFTTTVFVITLFLLAFGFRVTEGDLYYLNKGTVLKMNGF